MSTQSLSIPGASGAPLAADLELPKRPAHAFAVFAHCFTCTRRSLAAVRISRALAARGIGVLRFDFTGLGEDQEAEYADTFRGNIADVVAAAQVLAGMERTPSLLVGHSLGGAAVLAAASRLPRVRAVATLGAPFDVEHVKGLVPVTAPLSRRGDAVEVKLRGRRIRIGRSFLEDLSMHDQGRRIANLDRALLVLHSPTDEVVGVENASAIFQAAKHPKSFVALHQADHLLNATDDAEYVAGLIAAWVRPYLASPD